ncbi:hypothetical protein BDQ17DRAFT_1408824 [Cyathus striatus]|nr:hypothetical protein BDQ17DRAFT_1408824 [Cyathus striatus]
MKPSTTFASFVIAIISFYGTVSAFSLGDSSADLAMREMPESLEVRYPFHEDDYEYSRELADFYEDLSARVYEDEYDAIATRNFDDVEVYSRDEILEARHPIVRVVVQGIKMIVDAIKNGIAKDKEARSRFTVDLVGRIRGKYPGFNVAVCHTKHETKFDGVRGKDWGHLHEEFDVKIGGTVGYEIYWFKKGTFIRKGDGGYLNWAYAGNIAKKEDGGKRVTFNG